MKKILATPRSFGKTNPQPIEKLKAAGYEVVLNPTGGIMSEMDMMKHIADVDGIIVGVDPLNARVLDAAKKLRAIAKYGVGVDNIDLVRAKELGIPVSVTAGANADAVADYAFTLMLACARDVVHGDRQCRQGNWGKTVTLDIFGKKLGILGLGAIGKGVARRARGFDMEVSAYDAYWNESYAEANGIIFRTPEEMFPHCDFFSIHLPLLDDTRNLISTAAFAKMKPTAILVNTARGGIVDEDALVSALQNKKIRAAGLDVFSEEPPKNPALYQLDNLILSAHNAASTVGASENMGMMAATNLLRDLGENGK